MSLTASGSSDDLYIAKLDTSGKFLWATSAGGTAVGTANTIALDSAGNAYVAGTFAGTAIFGSKTLTASGSSVDIFVTKLDTSGKFLWATSAGGGSGVYGRGIALDSAGNTYITGEFFPKAIFGSSTLTSRGSSDIYIAKLDTSGKFLWATSAGGVSSDYSNGIALDSTGNTCVTGYIGSTAIFGSSTLTSRGSSDIYIAKLDTSGKLLWATSAGGALNDSGKAIGFDSFGSAYSTGYFEGTGTFGSSKLTSKGRADIFVWKHGKIP